MYISDRIKRAVVCFVVSIICLIFSIIYNIFSHGVHSPYMTYLFAIPFVLGTVPNLFLWLFMRYVSCHRRQNNAEKKTSNIHSENAKEITFNIHSENGEEKTSNIHSKNTENAISRISSNIYYSGVAAVTASSMLRGIFDIAGTASVYQTYLMYAGMIMLAVGVVVSIMLSFFK